MEDTVSMVDNIGLPHCDDLWMDILGGVAYTSFNPHAKYPSVTRIYTHELYLFDLLMLTHFSQPPKL